jgi:hypothetical protein
MSMHHEFAARLQYPECVFQRPATIRRARNHPERAEHASRVVERIVAEAIEFDEVRLNQWKIESRRRFGRGNSKHLGRQIDTQHTEAALREWQQQASGSASEICQTANLSELLFSEL